MRRTLAAFLLLPAVFIQPGPIQSQAPQIQFRSDYNETRKEAEKRGLPLVIYFTTDYCPWCVRLQQETFGDPTVSKAVNEHFVPLKVHAMREPALVEYLSIRAYPTIILAAPDGKILETIEGYRDAAKFNGSLNRVVAAVGNPEWMQRDYQFAVKAITDRHYGQGVTLLRGILEDGKSRPVQVNAANLLKLVEQQAATDLAQAKKLVGEGKTQEASALLTRLAKDYAGTQVAPQAASMLTSLAKTANLRDPQRLSRANEMLAQAREDFRTEQWLCCLDRCDVLSTNYGDLPEADEATQLAASIRANPEWLQQAGDSVTTRFGDVHLALAESWLQRGQRQQAIQCLERVVRACPGTRQAQIAQQRLLQIQGALGRGQ